MSQCSMCKASAASKDEAGSYFMGAGLNTGILFLLALPFLLCGFVATIRMVRSYNIDSI
ncbi:MAG: hypothetical protein AAF388_28020 [Bacteroidota bacterium]